MAPEIRRKDERRFRAYDANPDRGTRSVTRLLSSLRTDGYDRWLARLVLRSLTIEEAADLYEVIRLRYQRGAMILTSHAPWRSSSAWPAPRCSPAPP